MSPEKMVSLLLDKVVEAARDLNEYVICLDRIGSRIGAGEATAEMLLDYVVDRDVVRRIARLRADVFDALDEVIGSDRANEIAEESYRYGEAPAK